MLYYPDLQTAHTYEGKARGFKAQSATCSSSEKMRISRCIFLVLGSHEVLINFHNGDHHEIIRGKSNRSELQRIYVLPPVGGAVGADDAGDTVGADDAGGAVGADDAGGAVGADGTGCGRVGATVSVAERAVVGADVGVGVGSGEGAEVAVVEAAEEVPAPKSERSTVGLLWLPRH